MKKAVVVISPVFAIIALPSWTEMAPEKEPPARMPLFVTALELPPWKVTPDRSPEIDPGIDQSVERTRREDAVAGTANDRAGIDDLRAVDEDDGGCAAKNRTVIVHTVRTCEAVDADRCAGHRSGGADTEKIARAVSRRRAKNNRIEILRKDLALDPDVVVRSAACAWRRKAGGHSSRGRAGGHSERG